MKDDIIVINGSEEDISALSKAMEERRLAVKQARLEKVSTLIGVIIVC